MTRIARRIALTTSDNIFDAGGVENSVGRIARGMASTYGMQVDIIMLNAFEQSAFKPRGNNGIAELASPDDRAGQTWLAGQTRLGGGVVRGFDNNARCGECET